MKRRPLVTLKLATSLDGKIAARTGESRWITGEAARREVHALRAAHDAILIGVGTALADDPELTVRYGMTPIRPPMRIVLDSQLRLPTDSRLASTANSTPVVVFCAKSAPVARSKALEAVGVEVRRAGEGLDRVNPEAVIADIASHAESVFIEGGGQVAASWLGAGLVDRLEWFRAPIVIGGDGVDAVAALGLDALDHAPRFRRTALRQVGADTWETLERE